jgi:rubrerythrin
MASKSGNKSQVHELLYQALETEMGGILIYKSAISCATNKDLRKEWEGYLEETQTHHEVLLNVFNELGLDPKARTPGREVVAHLGESLVAAIKMAKDAGDPEAAQLVAAECVVLAETKDHSNWELIGLLADKLPAQEAKVLNQAYEAVNEDEEHHLYHTKGWARELWIESLGFPAVLPPPEEVKDVETAIGAARAQQSREKMLGKRH